MTANQITQYILTLPNVQTADNYGYKFFFYGDDHMRPFATLATSDSDYDRHSNLSRPGVFRLNIGIRKDTFQELFGTEKINPANYDFTQLDHFLPHPDYAPQFFICILNPSEATLPTVKKHLAEAHSIAAKRNSKPEKPS